MKLPPVIFFDLDDTIIAFGAVVIPVWRELCENYEQRTGTLCARSLFAAIRQASTWYWSDAERHRRGRLDIENARRRIVRQAFESLRFENMEAADAIADDYSRKRIESVTVFPGALETLQILVERGIKLTLVTNGDSEGQHAKIDRFELRSYFQHIFVEGDVGFGKPEPRIYHLALETMGVSPQNVWMVGDNLEWEVAVPQQLGIYSVWNDWRGDGLPDGSHIVPDRIVNNIRELV